mmetsp:Transcript_76524/g.236964  ORF Transcript_76524/g.236964 Transcript_76524/m.236964 type:complete len:209 (+) Transcript_76524:258-884(+)
MHLCRPSPRRNMGAGSHGSPLSAKARKAVMVRRATACCQKQMTVQCLASCPVLWIIMDTWSAEGTHPSIARTRPTVGVGSASDRRPRVSAGMATSLTPQTPRIARQSVMLGIGQSAAPRVSRSIVCEALATLAQASRRKARGPPRTTSAAPLRAIASPAAEAQVFALSRTLRSSLPGARPLPSSPPRLAPDSRIAMPTVHSRKRHTVP